MSDDRKYVPPEDILEGAQQRLMEQGTCECPRCGRLHHKLANKPPQAIAGVSLLREPVTASRRNDSLRILRGRISGRLNNHLCEMQEGMDDSIVGFNEAWDIVRAAFDEALNDHQSSEG